MGLHLMEKLDQAGMIVRQNARILPQVSRELERWRRYAKGIPNPELRRQALASIRLKRFHCEGGSVYAAFDRDNRGDLVPLIVALQTISDYLDNLCDRSESLDCDDFRQLHLAMTDALSPRTPLHDYYRLHPNGDDGGYLTSLVEECRKRVSSLPSYGLVQGEALRLASLYCDLQVYKHTFVPRRVPLLTDWFERHRSAFPGIFWWEFAAASGSTLGVFALFREAASPGLEPVMVQRIVSAYFPWVCGLHILLDYFIDQAEDRAGGDLNLVSYYCSREQMRERLHLFYREALKAVSSLPDHHFHKTVVKGLLAMYLSDRKVRSQGLAYIAREMIRIGGLGCAVLHGLCSLRRLKSQ